MKEEERIIKKVKKSLLKYGGNAYFNFDKKTFNVKLNNNDSYTFYLSNNDIEELNRGVYDKRTSIFKEIEFISVIQGRITINSFKNKFEYNLFENAIKDIKNKRIDGFIKYIKNLGTDIKDSVLNFYKKLRRYKEFYEIFQGIVGVIGTSITLTSLFEGYFLFSLYSLLATLSPTIICIAKTQIENRINRIKKLSYKRKSFNNYVENNLLKINFTEEKNLIGSAKNESIHHHEDVEDKNKILSLSNVEKVLNDNVFNAMYMLLIKVSNSNIDCGLKNIIIDRIKKVKEEYVCFLNQNNSQSIEVTYEINNEFIKKLAIIDLELSNFNQCNEDKNKVNEEIDTIDALIKKLKFN